MATVLKSPRSMPKLMSKNTERVFVSRFKITNAKVLLAKGKNRRSVRWHTRLSLCTIDAIATGKFFCGHKDSDSYRPSREEVELFRGEWQEEVNKRRKAEAANVGPLREMSKADICNVQLIHTDDLKDVFDSLLDAMTANVVMEEKLFDERWTPVS